MEEGRKEFEGKRVLVVEDMALVALDLKRVLQAMGCEVAGPVPTVQKGLELAEEFELDWAVLDVNLKGELVTPLAMLLKERNVPMLLTTGYDRKELPKVLQELPYLNKPISEAKLRRALMELMSGA